MRALPKNLLKNSLVAGFIILISVISYLRLFYNYELTLYDLRFKLRPPIEADPRVVLIDISDDTLTNLGEWPLPRDYHAALIDVLREHGAKMVIFDMFFSEPTLYDDIMVESMQNAGNVYLPAVLKVDTSLKRAIEPPRTTEIIADNMEKFKKAANPGGHINTFVDPDGKIRRVPLFINYNGSLIPQMAFKTACVFLGYEPQDLILKLPVSYQTSFIINYPGTWTESFLHFSYFEILKSYLDQQKGNKPKIDLSVLKDKVCFVGLTAAGTSDWKPNPLENVYPMVGLQASIFNSIITRNFIREADVVVNTIINVLIFLICLYITAKLPPLKGFIWCSLAGILYSALSFILFVYGLWINLFMPLIIIVFTFLGTTLYEFIGEIQRRTLLEKELDIARTIQKSFLPEAINEFKKIKISHFMQPAKFVAGDLYDILILDDTHLGIFIGDVSGKGVPASLIMAQTISLFRVFARTTGTCGEVLTRLNKELCGRLDGRFVTAFYLIVDIEKNVVQASSAGHSPLLFLSKLKNKIEEIEPESGPPLGVLDISMYGDSEIPFSNGDKIILYTDGISEARNKDGEEYGTKGIIHAITLVPKNLSLLSGIRDDVYGFARGLPQHDDITLIVLEF